MPKPFGPRGVVTMTTRNLLIVFFLAFFSPIFALFLKPMNYSFYMFFPARPDDAIDRFRLFAANAILYRWVCCLYSCCGTFSVPGPEIPQVLRHGLPTACIPEPTAATRVS
jgi:hypothetical protein